MIVVFGATGDLCKKKVFPALNSVLREKLDECRQTRYKEEQLDMASGSLSSSVASLYWAEQSPLTIANPEDPSSRAKRFVYMDEEGGLVARKVPNGEVIRRSGLRVPKIVGYGRHSLTRAQFMQKIDPSVGFLKELVDSIDYVQGEYTDAKRVLEEYFSKANGAEEGPTEIIFYLAVPPFVYSDLLAQLGRLDLREPRKIVIAEKPLGQDMATYKALEESIARHIREEKNMEFRSVDHYLFKNLLKQVPELRRAHPLLREIWSGKGVKSAKAVFKETAGVGNRLGYFDETGMIRDVLQNHVLQMLAVCLMDVHAESQGSAKLAVLGAIDTIPGGVTAYGQYEGYVEELGRERAPPSQTETYYSTRMTVGRGEWAGLTVAALGGKGLEKHRVGMKLKLATEAVQSVLAHKARNRDFEAAKEIKKALEEGRRVRGAICMQLTPSEKLSVKVRARSPAGKWKLLKKISVDFDRKHTKTDAYQRLFSQLVDDPRSPEGFVSAQEVEEQWRIVQNIVSPADKKLSAYKQGSKGPAKKQRSPQH